MKFVIRKVPERDTSYLERLIPSAVILNDTEHKGAIRSFIDAIKLADDDAVYVQDDMLLCKGFVEKAESYIKDHKNDVIIFANFTHDKQSADVVTEGYYPARKGGWLLCTYIPKTVADAFVKWHESKGYESVRNYKKYLEMQGDDILFCRFLELIDKDVFVTVPNIAGHRKNKSVINPNRPVRCCVNFDYEGAEI